MQLLIMFLFGPDRVERATNAAVEAVEAVEAAAVMAAAAAMVEASATLSSGQVTLATAIRSWEAMVSAATDLDPTLGITSAMAAIMG